MSWSYGGYPPYVPVAKRRQQAEKKVQALKKKGHDINPIVVEGRMIAKTFWGKAWCKHLESFSDYENRLPRGRTYVRNGSVIDLKLSAGQIKALVSGSSIYRVRYYDCSTSNHQMGLYRQRVCRKNRFLHRTPSG